MEDIESIVSKYISLIILVFGLITVFTFQNCSIGTEESNFASNAPFAYDVVLDSFGAMSCTFNDVDRNKYFNFKMGAYKNTSGVTLTDEFRNFIGLRNADDIAEILASSDSNVGAAYQLSIRSGNDYQSVVSAGSDVLGQNYNIFLAPLDSANIALDLGFTKQGERLNFFNSNDGLNANGRFETSFYLALEEEQLSQVRNDLFTGKFTLLTGFSSETSPNSQGVMSALGPTPNSNDSVYGSKFHPRFQKAEVNGVLKGFNRYLTGFTESSALNGAPIADWACYNFTMYPDLNTAEADGCQFPVTTTGGSGTPYNAVESAAVALLGQGKFHVVANITNSGSKLCLAPITTSGGLDVNGCYEGRDTSNISYSDLSTCEDTVPDNDCPHVFAFCLK